MNPAEPAADTWSVSNYDPNRRRGGRPDPQSEAVARGRRVVAERQDPAVQLAKVCAQQQRVRCMVVGLLATPDARHNMWTPMLNAMLRELAGDDA